MRCSSRSTTWRGRVAGPTLALCALAALAPLAAPPAFAALPAVDARVERAIVDAVRARMGAGAQVILEQIQATDLGGFSGDLTARPEPGARLARTIRFTLVAAQGPAGRGASVRVGAATARVYASIVHARAARSLEPGAALGSGDITDTAGEVGAVPMARLPIAADLVGSAVLRPVAAGDVLTGTVVAQPPLVRAGDRVEVRALAGLVEVTGEAVAAQAGRRGQTIRVVNPASRRAMRATVVGPGQVEVVR